MQEQNPIVSQIQEAVRRLEAELAQLKLAVSEKRKEVRQHKKALNMLSATRRESPGPQGITKP